MDSMRKENSMQSKMIEARFAIATKTPTSAARSFMSRP